MRKWELVTAAILALLLGGGIILVFNGSSQFDEGDLLESTNSPTAAHTVEVEQTSVPSRSSTTLDSSKENNRIASPTLAPIIVGEEKSPDMEDLLLLYSSEKPGSFDFNYCQIAEFYGLVCKKIDLIKTEITDQLLRDGFGKYFKLIGIDADILQQKPVLLSKSEMDILKTAIGTGRANLLIYNLNKRTIGVNITELVDGALLGATVPQDSHRDWFVSTTAPEITQEFTGQVITSTTSASQIDFALDLDPKATFTPLILSKDDAGASYLIFARLFKGAGSIFLNAGAPGWGLDTLSMRDVYYNPAHFSEIIPLMLTIRYILGEETWHNDHNYANLTVVAPSLTDSEQNLHFAGLLKEMKDHNFHTSIALPPVNWEKSELDVTSLFVENPDRYSLVEYGNNADGYEFYKYTGSSEDPYPARPLADQEWDILEGISRMKMLTEFTGIPFDKVMIFPYGISPEETLVLLKKNNYLASVNSQNIPLGVTPPENRDEGMAPVSLKYGNFPLMTWRWLGVNQPFQPIIQPILFDLFIGKPTLMMSDVYEKGVFDTGINAFNHVADQLNQISSGVEWLSLGDIIKLTYLEKVNDDDSVEVRMYTNDLILDNDSSVERYYHISKEETLNVSIKSLTVNSQEFPYRLEDGFLKLDIVLPKEVSAEIIIEY